MHDFQYENVQKCLHTIESSVNIVAHKKIVCCLEINHKVRVAFLKSKRFLASRKTGREYLRKWLLGLELAPCLVRLIEFIWP
jgi:hypothetical protein